jgi:type VI protein secretion system component Hcp
MSGGFIQVSEAVNLNSTDATGWTAWPGTTVVPATTGTPSALDRSGNWTAAVAGTAASVTSIGRKWSSLAEGSVSNHSTCNMEVHRDYPGVCSSGSPASGGRTEFSDFEIVKYPDQMTPKFFEACVTGATVKRIIVQIEAPGGAITYVLSDNNIASHNVKAPSRLEKSPLEIIKVIYTTIQIFAPGIDYFWDVQTNTDAKRPECNCILPLTGIGTTGVCSFA